MYKANQGRTKPKIGAGPLESEPDDQMDTVESVEEKKKRLAIKQKAHIAKTEFVRWKMDVKKKLTKSLGSELTSILIIIFTLGTIYYGTFIAYLWVVHIQFSFTLYYPQFSTQQPGQGQDQRVNLFSFLLFFSMMRLPVGLVFIWLMRRLGISWKINIYIVLFIITIILEVFTLITGLVIWGLCNNPYAFWDLSGPSNMCNDPDYCKAYGNLHPNYCSAGSYTGLSPDVLRPRSPFVLYLIFNLIFIGISIGMFIMLPSIMDFKINSQKL